LLTVYVDMALLQSVTPHLRPMLPSPSFPLFLLFPATTYTSTPSLHDALPIFSTSTQYSLLYSCATFCAHFCAFAVCACDDSAKIDRKSTRLNSSHVKISYAVVCLKKKKKQLALSVHATSSYMPT